MFSLTFPTHFSLNPSEVTNISFFIHYNYFLETFGKNNSRGCLILKKLRKLEIFLVSPFFFSSDQMMSSVKEIYKEVFLLTDVSYFQILMLIASKIRMTFLKVSLTQKNVFHFQLWIWKNKQTVILQYCSIVLLDTIRNRNSPKLSKKESVNKTC